ncbi:hypothetical protein ANN_17421 [Periplaneta americana]|uniref:Uncharacterized protein n=1 Tax=Periplaneta americana TaxID=6978 RepID=A0ABQ8STU6_PERAM|nr:hypothetical protein ANN_17421 [Periplaneta americana]
MYSYFKNVDEQNAAGHLDAGCNVAKAQEITAEACDVELRTVQRILLVKETGNSKTGWNLISDTNKATTPGDNGFEGQWYEVERSFYLMEMFSSCTSLSIKAKPSGALKVTIKNINRLALESPDLSPCDFDLNPQLKKSLRGKRFANREDILGYGQTGDLVAHKSRGHTHDQVVATLPVDL